MIRFLALLFSVLLFFTACDDNAYDGTGLKSGSTATPLDGNVFEALQTQILLPNVEQNIQEGELLLAHLKVLHDTVDSVNLLKTQTQFKIFMRSWKRVESVYIIKDYDNEMITVRDYNDVFHTHTVDAIPNSLRQFMNSDSNDSSALSEIVKNINALELIFYGEESNESVILESLQEKSARRVMVAEFIVEKMLERAGLMRVWYAGHKEFYSDDEASVDSLLNLLIDSSNKLSEWRIGDAAGLTNQYKDDLDYKRLEYYKSHLSLESVIAILESHKEVMDSDDYLDFGDFALAHNAESETIYTRETLSSALSLARSLSRELETSVASSEVKELYEALRKLHFAYYESLINALDLTAKIIEADGD